MTDRTMYDSTTAGDCPADGDLYAGYINGEYADYGAMAQAFPDKTHVRISVDAWHGPADVLDVENGDATPDQAPGWVNKQRGMGVAFPLCYCNRGNEGAVTAALRGAGLTGAECGLWVATLDGSVVGPGDVDGFPIVACQYQGQAQTGGHYDRSVVFSSTWPGAAEQLPAPVDHQEDNMRSQVINVTIGGGHGWVPLPGNVAPGNVVSVVPLDVAPDEGGHGYVPVPAFVGVSSDKPELVFGPGPNGPAPDGVYGFVLWTSA